MAKKKAKDDPRVVKMGNATLSPVKATEPPKEDLEKIQKGINEAGKQAMEQGVDQIHPEARIMSKRLDKIDNFIKQMIAEEGSDNLSPQEISQLLIIKARHNAFVYSTDTDNAKILLWLIEMVLFNADAIFAVTKAHLLAQNEAKNEENPQIQEKKSRKKPQKKAPK